MWCLPRQTRVVGEVDLVGSLLGQTAPVSRELEGRGHLVVLVGGAVRDALSGRSWREIDLATSASPEELERWLAPLGRVRTLGYGVVQLRTQAATYHLARLRQDSAYQDARHPREVDFGSSLDQDFRRRDYTVNAIGLSPDGTWIDPFLGRSDLERGILRALPQPVRRLAEDPLRILRGIRLISERSLAAEAETEAALWQRDALVRTPRSRADQELWRLIQGEAAGPTWNHYQGLLSVLWPWAGPTDLAPWAQEPPFAILAMAVAGGRPEAGLSWLKGHLTERRWERMRALVDHLGVRVDSSAQAQRTMAGSLSRSELTWLACLDARHYRKTWERAEREGVVRQLALSPQAIAALLGQSPGPWLKECESWLWQRVRIDPEQNSEAELRRAVLEWAASSGPTEEEQQ